MPRFPILAAADLNGRSLMLPAGFSSPLSLVFVAFEMRQQVDVDSWASFIDAAREKRPSLTVFELPTIARAYKLMRFVIDNGMRSGIPDYSTRAATVTLYTNVRKFTREIGIRTTREIAVLVVTPAGDILAQVSGRYQPKVAMHLEDALRNGLAEG